MVVADVAEQGCRFSNLSIKYYLNKLVIKGKVKKKNVLQKTRSKNVGAKEASQKSQSKNKNQEFFFKLSAFTRFRSSSLRVGLSLQRLVFHSNREQAVCSCYFRDSHHLPPLTSVKEEILQMNGHLFHISSSSITSTPAIST